MEKYMEDVLASIKHRTVREAIEKYGVEVPYCEFCSNSLYKEIKRYTDAVIDEMLQNAVEAGVLTKDRESIVTITSDVKRDVETRVDYPIPKFPKNMKLTRWGKYILEYMKDNMMRFLTTLLLEGKLTEFIQEQQIVCQKKYVEEVQYDLDFFHIDPDAKPEYSDTYEKIEEIRIDSKEAVMSEIEDILEDYNQEFIESAEELEIEFDHSGELTCLDLAMEYYGVNDVDDYIDPNDEIDEEDYEEYMKQQQEKYDAEKDEMYVVDNLPF